MDPQIAEFRSRLPESLGAECREAELLAPHTTLGVGGPADLFLRVRTREALATAALAAQRSFVPFIVLGFGSNVCAGDRGYRGVVISNGAAASRVSEATVADSGASLMRLSMRALSGALSGLEFAVGIPGTLGGGIASNAGAYGPSIGALVTELDVVDGGVRMTAPASWARFGYRDSRLRRPEAGGAVVLGATLALRPGNRDEIAATMRRYQRSRRERQPWRPSAGSFFKNVRSLEVAARVPGLEERFVSQGVAPAGSLVEACGLRGFRVGGAAVSEAHGNVLVNLGGACAADLRALAQEVRRRVHDRFGVMLEEEAMYVGEWE